MEQPGSTSWTYGQRFILATAATVIVVAALKAAAPMVNYFLLSLFIAVTSAAPVSWLEKRRVPRALAIFVVIVVLLATVTLMAVMLTNSLAGFTAALPKYRGQLHTHLAPWLDWLEKKGIHFDRPTLLPQFNPNDIMGLVVNLLGNVGSLLSNALLVIVTVIFMLLDSSGFQHRIRQVSRDPVLSAGSMGEFTHHVRRYLAIKVWTSLVTGLLVGTWVYLSGLDYPALWAIVAFFFNFVPNFGSVLAAIPAILLALAQLGVWPAVLVAIGYLVVNLVIGMVLEPRLMGRGVGLPTSVVFVSLIFWGWLLGPIGMILAVPLTGSVKIALASSADTRWLAALLSDSLSETPGPFVTPLRAPGQRGHH